MIPKQIFTRIVFFFAPPLSGTHFSGDFLSVFWALKILRYRVSFLTLHFEEFWNRTVPRRRENKEFGRVTIWPRSATIFCPISSRWDPYALADKKMPLMIQIWGVNWIIISSDLIIADMQQKRCLDSIL